MKLGKIVFIGFVTASSAEAVSTQRLPTSDLRKYAGLQRRKLSSVFNAFVLYTTLDEHGWLIVY